MADARAGGLGGVFRRAGGDSDRVVAERVVQVLGLSLATPVHDFAIKRDRAGVALVFHHANGRHKVTVLDGRAQVARTRGLTLEQLVDAACHYGGF